MSFIEYCKNNQHSEVKQNIDKTPETEIKTGFSWTCDLGNIETLKVFIEHGFKPEFIDLMSAINHKQTDVIRILLESPHIDPTENDNEAIWESQNLKDSTDIQKLLFSDQRIYNSLQQTDPKTFNHMKNL